MFSSATPFGRHTVSPLWDCRIAGEFRIVKGVNRLVREFEISPKGKVGLVGRMGGVQSG